MAPPSSLRSVRSTRVRALSDAFPPSSMPSLPTPTTPSYSHVSSYRSLQMELLVYSPSVKVVSSPWSTNHTLPVFGDHDVVGGKVILDPSCQSGRLILTIEGAFTYNSTEKTENNTPSYESCPEKKRHVFFSSSKVIQISSSDNSPRSAFRDVFVLKRRPSGSSIKSMVLEPRVHGFSFDLPRSQRSGEEMPPTFSYSDPKSAPFEVVYKLSALWESSDITENPSFLDVPIIMHQDTDFHSVDVKPDNSTSWLEMPLKSDRPTTFRCAVTLPTSVTFSRAASIPFFVVFTTTPRSSPLAREIAADATISITVFSQITITEPAVLPITPPQTPQSEESSSDSSSFHQGSRLLRRVRSRQSPWSARSTEDSEKDKPLPRLPTQTAFTTTQTIYNGISIGFPKRPRHQHGPEKHPSLHAHQALPDGLYKSKIPLDREMLPSIDWASVSVKYYMDVSVLFGQEELRGRVPLRII
ncbi:hypothetical protein MIND_00138700 [Mycena indigotica]|uniref:Uncharacterized protein n=1 Tax=Mycena indigotica TaxID=2126181 RepID=A0A8H6WIJ5_9AGAR|nr:uncharacterized protein MIND_00138700 [Mycena indigotica]KAF7316203.1 hypothetical protein MIND_00138700 [Mycena indigotica]